MHTKLNIPSEQYKEVLQKVYSSEKLLRLKDIIGFTGLGADLERKYIHDTAVYYHDLRVAEVCKKLLLDFVQFDSSKSQFIALTHDYSAFPFRQFATKGVLKELIESTNYNSKNRHIELLKADGIELDESLILDILNFDIAPDRCKNLTNEGKIAVSCESVVTVYEDILLALKYGIIAYEDIPADLIRKLDFPQRDSFDSRISANFSSLMQELSLNFCKEHFSDVVTLENEARSFKSYARTNFIVEKIFKEKEKQIDMLLVSSLYKKYQEKFIKEQRNYTELAFLNDLTIKPESFLIDL